MELLNPRQFHVNGNQTNSPTGTFPPKSVEVNQQVLFYEQAHKGTPKQGWVLATSRMGDGSPGPCISVNVVDGNRIMRRDSVRHIDDPDAQMPTLKHNGAWDYVPRTREMQEIYDRLDRLEGGSPSVAVSEAIESMPKYIPGAISNLQDECANLKKQIESLRGKLNFHLSSKKSAAVGQEQPTATAVAAGDTTEG